MNRLLAARSIGTNCERSHTNTHAAELRISGVASASRGVTRGF